MALEFRLPDVGEGVAEGEIVQWLVGPGDAVSEDQPLVEVETDKAVVEIPSPVDGTVKELRAEAGDVVPVGDVFVVLEVEGEESEARSTSESGTGEGTDPGAPEDVEAELEPEAGGDGEGGAAGTAAADDQETDDATDRGRVFAAPSARRLARELGVDIATVAGSGPGGRVTEGDVRAATESPDGPAEDGHQPATAASGPDRAAGAAPEPGEASGPDVAVEASVPGETGEAGPGAGPGGVTGAGATPAGRDRTLATPATRRVAAELDVDIDDVPATETRDGEAFVTEAAVREYAAGGGPAQAAAGEGLAIPAQVPAGEEERVPYRGVRRTIGEQMERSAYTAPHVTHHDSVDVTNLVEARERLAARADERGIKLTYLPFVVTAVVAVLKEFPILNSRLDEDADEIIKHGYYNVGVATATDAGLMVPVVPDADRKSLLQLASESNELVQKARDRSISREEMQGGTFTITNFGAIGGEYATPIINYPETAILGLGAITERPWVVDGEVEARHVMTLSLSIDHRVIDGAEAARFTNRLKEYLEHPSLLLVE